MKNEKTKDSGLEPDRRVHGTAEQGVDDEALKKAIEGSSEGSGEGVERGDEKAA